MSSRTPSALGYEQYGREQAEVLVDCVTYFVARLGRPRRRRRVDPLHRRLGRRRRPGRHPRVRPDDRHDRAPHRSRARLRRREPTPTRSPRRARAAERGRELGRGCARPDGRASPAGWPRREHAATAARAGRRHPGRGACSPRPNPTATDSPRATRRRGRPLPPPPPRASPRRRARRQRAARAHRGRLPDRVGDHCSAASPSATRSSRWLRVVAIHEAYRLSALERRDAQLERPRPRRQGLAGRHRRPRSLDDALEAREALRVLAELPERQRADLTLRVAGFSYARDRRDSPAAAPTPTSTSTSPRPALESDSLSRTERRRAQKRRIGANPLMSEMPSPVTRRRPCPEQDDVRQPPDRARPRCHRPNAATSPTLCCAPPGARSLEDTRSSCSTCSSRSTTLCWETPDDEAGRVPRTAERRSRPGPASANRRRACSSRSS